MPGLRKHDDYDHYTAKMADLNHICFYQGSIREMLRLSASGKETISSIMAHRYFSDIIDLLFKEQPVSVKNSPDKYLHTDQKDGTRNKTTRRSSMTNYYYVIIAIAMIFSPLVSFAADQDPIPGFNLTIGQLGFPAGAGRAVRAAAPSIEQRKGAKFFTISTQYVTDDASAVSVRVHLFVPLEGAGNAAVKKNYEGIKKSRLSRGDGKSNYKKVHVHDGGDSFEAEYEYIKKNTQYRHVGSFITPFAYIIDAFSTKTDTNPVDLIVDQLEKACNEAMAKLNAAQKGKTIATKIPGHSTTVPDLGIPARTGDMSLHESPNIYVHDEKQVTMISWVFWDKPELAQNVLYLKLYLPAPGAEKYNSAHLMLMEDFQGRYQYLKNNGFEVEQNTMGNQRFFIDSMHKEKGQKLQIQGFIMDKYAYSIQQFENIKSSVSFGAGSMQKAVKSSIELLKKGAGPKVKRLDYDEEVPDEKECYDRITNRVPRANLEFHNLSQFKLIVVTQAWFTDRLGFKTLRTPARVVVEPETKRFVHHALPAGRTFIRVDRLDMNTLSAVLDWEKVLDNTGTKFCDKTYILTVTNADLGVGNGPKGSWHIKVKQAQNNSQSRPIETPDKKNGEWETVVD